MMKRHRLPRTAAAATLVAVLSVLPILPAQADPPPWAPAYGARNAPPIYPYAIQYLYVYYPMQQVYYSPEQQIWFWMSGGNWQFGVSLPPYYHIDRTTGVSIMLGTPPPYVEHIYVEEQYGRPWRERHLHKENDKGKDKHPAQRRRD